MLLDIALFVIGFYILVKGAGLLIEGSASLARSLGMSGFLIGLVIVGLGTSIPEFAITLFSNLVGDAEIGLGTLIGSNTFNILFILGISALFFPIVFKREWAIDALWNLGAIALVAVFVILPNGGTVGRTEGLILLVVFAYWLYDNIKRPSPAEEEGPLKIFAYPITIVLIFAGFAGIILGGKWVVDGAETIARTLGLSEAVVGLTLLSIGTSLPELAVTFTAALKKQAGIAIGNIVGSNVVNFLLILGSAAAIKPIILGSEWMTDVFVAAGAAGLLYGFMYWGKKHMLERWQGAAMVFLYALYLIYTAMKMLA